MTTPRLNSDVYFVPTGEGVCFLTNHGIEVFKGASIYSWIERLAPHLDGRHTLSELTAGLAEDKRAMVEKTVAALLAKGLARDVAVERPDTLLPWERQRYAGEIAYLERFHESPGLEFQRFRDSRLLVVGSGVVFAATIRAVVESGVRQVTAAVTEECATDRARLAELVAAARDDRQHVRYVRCRGAEDDLLALVADADVVLHASDRPMLGRALSLDQHCARQATVIVQAAVVGDEAWIGPVSGDGTAWESAWRRLRSAPGDPAFVDRPRAAVSPNLAGPVAALVANQVAMTAFRRVTGVDLPAPIGVMRRVDLATLGTTTHRCHPHPSTLPAEPIGAAELVARVEELRGGGRLDADTFDKRAAALVDPRLGILVEVAEEDLAQVPLNVAAVTVAGSPSTVTGAGLTFRSARWRAALRAVACYAHSFLDPRRTVQGSQGRDVWGYDLAAGVAHRVPAALAFAPGDGRGVAARYGWADAVASGLLAHCRAVTIAEMMANELTFRQVDLDTLDLDGDATTYRRLLDIAGVPVVVHDLTGTLAVPTLAFSVGPRTVAYACHLDWAEAVRDGLEQTLLDYQARTNNQPVYAPPAPPDLPARRRGPLGAAADRIGPVDVDAVVAALARAGRTPVVVPLDHDPALVSAIPYVVNVVLADD
jgi:hypothetical protein